MVSAILGNAVALFCLGQSICDGLIGHAAIMQFSESSMERAALVLLIAI